LPDQQNFYPQEYNHGLIQLKDGQRYLFDPGPGPEWYQRVRMTRVDGSGYVEASLQYNTSLKRVTFDIPANFQNSRFYNFEVLNIPKSVLALDANVKNVETQLEADDGTAVLTTKDIEGQLARLEVKSLYASKFRTSKYNTFQQKLNNIRVGSGSDVWQWLYVSFLQAWVDGDESFSNDELQGSNSYPKLISIEADLPNTPWFTSLVGPKMYDNYPYRSVLIVGRADPDFFGIPPIRDIRIENAVNVAEPPYGTTPAAVPFNRHFISYNIMRQVENDFYYMQSRAGNYLLDHPGFIDARLSWFLVSPPPYLRYGDHKVTLSYKPPGADQRTSAFGWNLFNAIRINE
jgi:hypothetical protein